MKSGSDRDDRKWLMRREDFERALKQEDPATALRDMFALPQVPTVFQEVTLPQNTAVRVAIAGGNTGWGSGGAVPLEILRKPAAAWFVASRRITP